MAGKTGKCVTELGVATHKYWYGSDTFYRQPIGNKTIGGIEVWTGTAWEQGWIGDKAAPGNHTLPNAVSIPHTP